ncbi:hypothetical protein P691DRAFT_781163 [Macrolepiota fuliginosa MF-IS2]|uniref:F-box domain-containing protein n=1 Tax=Macrolepiota fuliginosa MF-IS2 TaxID=1400762 RepID=A0A9P5XDI7_9AGAR|nr:hypothetical protein P691DRAFT_781163 [Macrolepiota fuliginosa MF-IS2]
MTYVLSHPACLPTPLGPNNTHHNVFSRITEWTVPTPKSYSSLEVDSVASQISNLELRREQLVRELSDIDLQLRKERARYNTLLNGQAAISKIPIELLSSIFLLCQVAGPPKPYYSFAMAASHVSRHWRTVSLTTPLLWNDIQMNIRSMASLARLETHLIRSNDCFLDIFIYTPIPDLASVMRLLSSHSKRWRRFSLMTPNDHLNTIYTYLHSSSAPLLEHLSLQVGIPEEHNSPRSKYPGYCPKIFAEGTPSLKFIRLGGVAFGNLAPPLDMVSTLDLDGFERYYMEPSQFVALMESLPSIVNLSLGQLHIHHPRDPFDVTKQIELPLLRSLRICGLCTSPHLVLSLLVLPQLESLILLDLDSFHSPVLPSVKELTIESCSFDEIAATNIYHACPSITHLTIDLASPALCSAMTISAENLIPCPSVHTLTVRDLEPGDFARFRIMVSTRIASDRAFKKLRLDRRTRTVLRNKLCLDWFREHMTVENCDHYDPWPADLGYDDPGDYYV